MNEETKSEGDLRQQERLKVSVGALIRQTHWSQALLWIKTDGGNRVWGPPEQLS